MTDNIREPKMKPIKVRCLKSWTRKQDDYFDGELIGKADVILFQEGKEYPVSFYKDFLMSAQTEEGDWEVVADDPSFEGVWTNDKWFLEQFQMLFE